VKDTGERAMRVTRQHDESVRSRRTSAFPLRRVTTALVCVLLLLLPTACAPPSLGNSAANSSLGGDACLLLQYQGRNENILSRMQDGVGVLTSSLDALHSRDSSISPQQDITQTVFAIAKFQSLMRAQYAQIVNGAQPPEGRVFRDDVAASLSRFDTMSTLLTQAYTDARNGDPRASADIAAAARGWMRQGQTLLNGANEQIAGVATFSPNC